MQRLIYQCDFENDWCDMVQTDTRVYPWVRHTGDTVEPGTGPSSAMSGQYYMYARAGDASTSYRFVIYLYKQIHGNGNSAKRVMKASKGTHMAKRAKILL